jgi:hypothetical protein
MPRLAKHPLFKVTCQQASRLLSERQDQPLKFGQRVRLRLHLAACDACTNVSRQFETLRLAMRNLRDKD